MSIEHALDKFQRMKRERIAFIVYELLERGGEANLEEFKGSIAVNYGIRQVTLEEYFEDLKSAGMICTDKIKLVLRWSKEQVAEWLKNKDFTLPEKKGKGAKFTSVCY